jgi:hypothetical protein
MDESSQLNLHEDPRGRPDGEAGRFERADESRTSLLMVAAASGR